MTNDAVINTLPCNAARFGLWISTLYEWKQAGNFRIKHSKLSVTYAALLRFFRLSKHCNWEILVQGHSFSLSVLVAPRVETACWPHASRLEPMAVEDEDSARPRNLWQHTHRDGKQHQWRTNSSESIRASQEGNIDLKFRPIDCRACLSFRCLYHSWQANYRTVHPNSATTAALHIICSKLLTNSSLFRSVYSQALIRCQS